MKKYPIALTLILSFFAINQAYSQANCYPGPSCYQQPNNCYQQQPNSSCYQKPSYPNPYDPYYHNSRLAQEETPCLDDSGMYVGLYGGANWLKDHNHHSRTAHRGYTGAASIGHKFDNGFRAEAEVAYRHNKLNKVRQESEHIDVKGHRSTISAMGNVLYDFDTGTCLTPYVGVGAGIAQVRESYSVKDSSSQSTHLISAKSKGVTGAYQGIAGISCKIAPKTDLGLEYRYFSTAKHRVDHSVGLALRQSF